MQAEEANNMAAAVAAPAAKDWAAALNGGEPTIEVRTTAQRDENRKSLFREAK